MRDSRMRRKRLGEVQLQGGVQTSKRQGGGGGLWARVGKGKYGGIVGGGWNCGGKMTLRLVRVLHSGSGRGGWLRLGHTSQ
jgi:hypothetical protein